MRINESRGQVQPLRLDRALRLLPHIPGHHGDAARSDPYISFRGWLSCAVYHDGAVDQNVEHLSTLLGDL